MTLFYKNKATSGEDSNHATINENLQKLFESYNKRNHLWMNGRNSFLKQKQKFMSQKRSDGQTVNDSESDEEVLDDDNDESGENGKERRDEEMKRFIRNHHLRFRNGRVGRSANNPELRKLLLLGR